MVSENRGMEGKGVLITGGTSGIGKAAATVLAAMGAEVVVTGRNNERGEKALAEIRRNSGSEKVSPAQSRDEALQNRLWEVSEEPTKLKVPS